MKPVTALDVLHGLLQGAAFGALLVDIGLVYRYLPDTVTRKGVHHQRSHEHTRPLRVRPGRLRALRRRISRTPSGAS